MTITRELVSEEKAKQSLMPLACPKCGNTTAGRGISHWWYVTRTRAVFGTLNGQVVTDTDSEEADFDHEGEPKIRAEGFYCNDCGHEWDDSPDRIDIADAANDLGLKATLDRLFRDGWETVAACGGHVRPGDAVVRGTTVYEITTVTERQGATVVCQYGSAGNGGSFPLGLYEEVRVLRRGPMNTLPRDVVNFLTGQAGVVQHRVVLTGLRAELEAFYEKRSVYRFLDAWTGGSPVHDCWHHLRRKPPETT